MKPFGYYDKPQTLYPNKEDYITYYVYDINHCTYTTKWQSEIDYYSFTEETCEYRDEVKGKITEGRIPMTKKDVLIIEV